MGDSQTVDTHEVKSNIEHPNSHEQSNDSGIQVRASIIEATNRMAEMDNSLSERQSDEELESYRKFTAWLKRNIRFEEDPSRPFHQQMDEFSECLSDKMKLAKTFCNLMQSVQSAVPTSNFTHDRVTAASLSPQVLDMSQKWQENLEKAKSKVKRIKHLKLHGKDMNKHNVKGKFYCKCHAMFQTKAQLNIHAKYFNEQKTFECPKCSKRFLREAQLNQHTFFHNDAALFSLTHELSAVPLHEELVPEDTPNNINQNFQDTDNQTNIQTATTTTISDSVSSSIESDNMTICDDDQSTEVDMHNFQPEDTSQRKDLDTSCDTPSGMDDNQNILGQGKKRIYIGFTRRFTQPTY